MGVCELGEQAKSLATVSNLLVECVHKLFECENLGNKPDITCMSEGSAEGRRKVPIVSEMKETILSAKGTKVFDEVACFLETCIRIVCAESIDVYRTEQRGS